MTPKQIELIKKHGTPKQFEAAIWDAWTKLEITTEEANAAITGYNHEFTDAGEE